MHGMTQWLFAIDSLELMVFNYSLEKSCASSTSNKYASEPNFFSDLKKKIS